MKDEYNGFVTEIKNRLSDTCGIAPERMHLEPENGEERLLIECAAGENLKGVCSIRVRDAYERLKRDSSVCVDDLVNEISRGIDQVFREDIAGLSDTVKSYENARGRLFIRLLNYDRERKKLADAVYRKTGDIAQVLYVQISEEKGMLTSAKLPRFLISDWGLDEEDVFRDALVNTYFLSPPRAFNWKRVAEDFHYEGENFMDLLHPCGLDDSPCGNCISTKKKTNGAVSVFLPGVAARLSDLLDDDLYLSFTSVHEVMVHGARSADPETLRRVLKSTIEAATPEEDYLTETIYRYSRKDQSFSAVC